MLSTMGHLNEFSYKNEWSTVKSVISGVGSYLPDNVISNDDLSQILDTSDEWIQTRTGISQRHIILSDQTTSDLATEAAKKAMAAATRDDIDMIIVATTTPDQTCPAMAPAIAISLGLQDTPALDISAACTGFLYGLSIADSMIRSGTYDSVLVIGAEVFSTLLDPTDRTTRVIFGDGAGAVVVEKGSVGAPGEILSVRLSSDGTRQDDIYVASGGVRERMADSPVDPYFRMNGQAVFLRAVLKMEEAARLALDDAGWEPSKLDGIVSHQANARIIRALAEQLDVPEDHAFMNIADVGNTAAASIPIAMSAAYDSQVYTPGSPTLLAAYGAGATWGAAAFRWLA